METGLAILTKATANLLTEERQKYLSESIFPWWSRPRVYAGMPFDEIVQRIRGAKRELLILQSWLSIWNDLKCEIPRVMQKRDAFRVEMIYSNPAPGDDSVNMCEMRGVHSGLAPLKATGYAKEILESSVALRNDPSWGRRVDLRVTNELPTCALVKIDDLFYFTPFLKGQTTRHTFTLRFSSKNRLLATDALNHFRRVSDSEKTRRYDDEKV